MRIPVLLAALCFGSLATAASPASVAEAQASQKDIVEKLESDYYDFVKPAHREKIARARPLTHAIDGRTMKFDRLAVALSGKGVPIEDWRVVAEIPLGQTPV